MADEIPLINGETEDGRDTSGRFTPGRKGGPGNPYNKQVLALRAVLLSAVTPEKMKRVVDRVINAALNNPDDRTALIAAKEIIDRVLGKSVQQINMADSDGNNLQTAADILRDEFMKNLAIRQAKKDADGKA